LAAADHIPCSILSDTTVRHAARLFTYLNISKAAFIRAVAPAAMLRSVVGSIVHTNIVLDRWLSIFLHIGCLSFFAAVLLGRLSYIILETFVNIWS
jgi:hypothetical protein